MYPGSLLAIGAVFNENQTLAKTALHYLMEKLNNSTMKVAFDSYDIISEQADNLIVTKDGTLPHLFQSPRSSELRLEFSARSSHSILLLSRSHLEAFNETLGPTLSQLLDMVASHFRAAQASPSGKQRAGCARSVSVPSRLEEIKLN